LATVLFTDIVDSTGRATELGDRRWRDLLDAHNLLMQREVTRFRGRMVKQTGDGVLATFDGPARAIRCALSATDGVTGLGVHIRAALHTGEVELIGDDVGGIAVHIAARVLEKTRAQEVLVSRTVRDLVAGSGLRFSDRGVQHLKGLPEKWHVFRAEP
jgi:class 3 adenylate cyclase